MEHFDTTTACGAGERPLNLALRRGFARRCPACGEGRLYAGFLAVNAQCPACGEELHHHRADDAPPYFVMLLVGHVIVAGVLALEQSMAPAEWVHLVLWLPLTLLLSLWLLPRVKGMIVAIQWANRMHGFGHIKSVNELNEV
ncbi:MAG: hypothetical protein RLZ98_3570 [Pseudomonadota bacterium]|jgi:uncharacterized protein (DUF983 family)